MEGRRVTRKNQKYNPLFILFLCLIAAVIILLIVSVVFGIRLGKANKQLKAADAEISELKQTVSQLEDDLAAAKRAPSATPTDSGNANAPAIPDANQPAAGGSSWLDLTGHNEVKVKPANLLSAYETYYTTAGVNLRSGPATSYDRITTVDLGEKVQIAAREGGWSFAKVGSKFGWISSDYLSTSQPSPQPARPRAEATSGTLTRN